MTSFYFAAVFALCASLPITAHALASVKHHKLRPSIAQSDANKILQAAVANIKKSAGKEPSADEKHELKRAIQQLLAVTAQAHSKDHHTVNLLSDNLASSEYIPGSSLLPALSALGAYIPDLDDRTLVCAAIVFFAGKAALCGNGSNFYILSGIAVGYGSAVFPSGSVFALVQEVHEDGTISEFAGHYIGFMGDAGYYLGLSYGVFERTIHAQDKTTKVIKLHLVGVSGALDGAFANVNSGLALDRFY